MKVKTNLKAGTIVDDVLRGARAVLAKGAQTLRDLKWWTFGPPRY